MTTPTWNLNELYDGPDDPRIERDIEASTKAVAAFEAKWRNRDDYLCEPAALREALDEYETLFRDYGMASGAAYYFELLLVMNQSDKESKARAAQLDKLSSELANRISFFTLRLGKISPELQEQILTAPALAPYRYWLERRFAKAAYDHDERTEQVLRFIVPQASEAWARMIEEKLSTSEVLVWDGTAHAPKPFEQVHSLISSSDRRVREDAIDGVKRVLADVAPIAEHEINAIVTTNLRDGELRGYARPEHERYLHDGLDEEVVETMLTAVEGQFDIARRFYELKFRLTGQTPTYWGRAVSYGKLPDDYTFEQALGMVLDSMAELDPEFATEVRRAMDAGRIDAVARAGKRGGAACWHNLISQPSYLMQNFTGRLRDVTTLAHELGHYLNNIYMQRSCHALSYGAPTPLAEVASTFQEDFVLDRLLDGADDEARLAILMAILDDSVATIFRQTAAMRFEQELYRQIKAEGYLSRDKIGEIFARHMATYIGEEAATDAADGWVYWSHFRNLFYNYSYSFALLVARILQARVIADPAYIGEVKRFLAGGRRRSPRELLESLGIDVTSPDTWNEGIDRVAAKLAEAEALAAKLGKLPAAE